MTADREALVAEVAGMLGGSHFVIHDHTPPAIGEHIHLSPQAAAHLADALADLLAARDRRVRAEAWTEGFDRGFYDPLAGHGAIGRDASESAARNPYEADA